MKIHDTKQWKCIKSTSKHDRNNYVKLIAKQDKKIAKPLSLMKILKKQGKYSENKLTASSIFDLLIGSK